MLWWVKCSPYQYEDWSSDLQNQSKKRDMVAQVSVDSAEPLLGDGMQSRENQEKTGGQLNWVLSRETRSPVSNKVEGKNLQQILHT